MQNWCKSCVNTGPSDATSNRQELPTGRNRHVLGLFNSEGSLPIFKYLLAVLRLIPERRADSPTLPQLPHLSVCRLHRMPPSQKEILGISIRQLHPDRCTSVIVADHSVAVAKGQVAKWFKLKLGDLESKGVRVTTRQRRKVPKKELLALLDRYKNMRVQHVDALIAELKGVIERSDVVEWQRRMFDDDYTFMKDRVVDNLFKIKGPAVKAYLWLLMREEELA